MIRVNLLPPYVGQRRLVRRLLVAYVVVFVLITTAMFTYSQTYLIPALNNAETQASTAEANKAVNDALNQQAADVLTAVGPTQSKLNFVAAVHDYNKQWPLLYDRLARATDPNVTYSSVNVSGQSMAISAYMPSISEVGIYLQKMYSDPDMTSVTIDHLPGYPEAVVKKYYLDGKLIGVGTMPSFASTAGPIAAEGPTGGVGGGPQFRGGPPAGMGGPPAGLGFRPMGGGGGSGATTDETGERIWTPEQVLADRLNPIATPDQRARALLQAEQRVVVKTVPQGFSVNVSATLKSALTPPALPG
ncbi:MAG: PilN domain-containing protein [Capsulimonadaceae bacterium]